VPPFQADEFYTYSWQEMRMAVAAKAGCEFAVIVAQGGTISLRNVEKLELLLR